MVGETISHYKVLSEVGRGGMGVVYKAEDTKLRRTVALKFLRSDLIEDPENRERFLREAQAAAALDHPNICTVHEIDEVDGQTFIAMAFLEGQTAKDKLKERPLKLEKALDIAVQTAQGLQAAHEKGIVHRDIKGANLMVTPQGQVKIMDFGLAQLAEQSRLTKTATILGTPAYMSPEQAQRQHTDRRTDIWSLAVVIYEMVTGSLPFEGERQEAVLYAIGNEEPEPITALRSGIPMELDWIVGKALAKEPDDRYQHIEEMTVDIRGLIKKLKSNKTTILAGSVGRQLPSTLVQRSALSAEVVSKRKLRLHQVMLALTSGIALILALLYFPGPPAENRQVLLNRFSFTPATAVRTDPYSTDLAISPNGRHIAFVAGAADRQLWVQDLDQQQPRAIEGTEGARGPFWAPRSDFIGFATNLELKKVPVQGGPATQLCELPNNNFWGGSWSPDGEMIVFSSRAPSELYEVSARGGRSNPLLSPSEVDESAVEQPLYLARPHFLPSEAGRVLVFVVGGSTGTSVILLDLEKGRQQLLGEGESPFYSATGHIVYQAAERTHTLWALPFALDTLQAAGDAFPITRNARGPTTAADGTLVYLDGVGSRRQQLVWLDRSGKKTAQIGLVEPAIRSPELSPDGRLIAVTLGEGANEDVWLYNIARAVKTRVTTNPRDDFLPVWSPDGEQLAFTSQRGSFTHILARRLTGSGEVKEVAAEPAFQIVSDWSRNGRYVLYHRNHPKTGSDLWYSEINEGGDWEPHPFLQTIFHEYEPRSSPDGRYVAYVSDESGRNEVYLRPFPQGGPQTVVSSDGGTQVRWHRDGKELFYVEDGSLVAVPVSTEPTLSLGAPTRLFEHVGLVREGRQERGYDVSADGQKFVVAEPVGETPKASIRVVQNWYEEFRDREQD